MILALTLELCPFIIVIIVIMITLIIVIIVTAWLA